MSHYCCAGIIVEKMHVPCALNGKRVDKLTCSAALSAVQAVNTSTFLANLKFTIALHYVLQAHAINAPSLEGYSSKLHIIGLPLTSCK